MKTVTLKNGTIVPRIGQGSWYLGDGRAARAGEIAALRRGIELGMTLIDTAEMYGGGRSEQLVGEAVAPYAREKLFIVSKVLPGNAGRRNIFKSCEDSLRRLRTEYLDCYLLHWRGGVPLRETMDCMRELQRRGLIRSFGVSNFDTHDIDELCGIPGGADCAVNQVLYHLGSRGVEFSLLPKLKEKGMAMMAYCPLAQAGSLRRGLLQSESVKQIANEKGADVFQILLAFAMRDERVIAIPKAADAGHVEQNFASLSVELSPRDMKIIEHEFPAPAKKTPLDIQ